MRSVVVLLISSCLLLAGCSGGSNAPAAKPTGGVAVTGEGSQRPGVELGGPIAPEPETPAAGGAGPAAGESKVTPVAIESGTVTLSPESTKILFIGTHVGEPNPRTGGFEKFAGKLELDAAAKSLTSISIQIESDSLWTQIDRLTNHLKSPDFLEVREYPMISFESSGVAAGAGEGQFEVTGKLTLHGVEKEIRFPATVQFSEAGLTLTSEFKIDRTEFGIVFGPDRVQKEVALTVVVGEKTQPLPQQQGPGGGGAGRGGPGGGPGRGGPGGGFDPLAVFKRRDTNGDGKLAGDEIADRLRDNLASIDSNGDGEISLEEFQKGMRPPTPGGATN